MEEKTTWDAVAGPSNNRLESSPPDVPQNRVDLIVLSDSAPNTDLETMSTKDGAGEKDQYYLWHHQCLLYWDASRHRDVVGNRTRLAGTESGYGNRGGIRCWRWRLHLTLTG